MVCGLWTLSAGGAEVSPKQASAHIGDITTVCGVVASAKYGSGSRAQPTFLDLGRPYPEEIFVAVIFGSDRKKFGKPEIVLTDPSQLAKAK
jgi:hypothetical protein